MLVSRPESDFEAIHNLMMQSVSANVVLKAVELDLFDVLSSGPASGGKIADALNVDEHRLEPLLDILVVVDLLALQGENYTLTPVAEEFLTTASPLYQGLCLQQTFGFVRGAIEGLGPFLAGEPMDHSAIDEQWSEEEAMEGTAQEARGAGLAQVVEVISRLPGFDGFQRMADVGGNHAMYTMGVLERNNRLRGEILDLPHVAERAGVRCCDRGFGDRITAIGLDFRSDELRNGAYDLVLTSHFLYVFKDRLAWAVGKLARGLKPGGWFVAHHYAERTSGGDRLAKASLELITRIAGYSSHFVEQTELAEALAENGLTDIRFHQVSNHGKGLIVVARKPA